MDKFSRSPGLPAPTAIEFAAWGNNTRLKKGRLECQRQQHGKKFDKGFDQYEMRRPLRGGQHLSPVLRFQEECRHEHEFRVYSVNYWQFGVMRRAVEALLDMPTLVVRVVHPDYEEPSQWFSVDMFGKLFLPKVVAAVYHKLQSDFYASRAVQAATAMVGAARTFDEYAYSSSQDDDRNEEKLRSPRKCSKLYGRIQTLTEALFQDKK